MRVLLLAMGSRGDVQPFVALAQHMRARGHDVTLAAPPNFAAWIRAQGLYHVPLGPDVEALTKAHGHLIDTPHRFVPLLVSTVSQSIDELFGLLPDLASGKDAILSGSLDMAGPSIAEWLGIPHVGVHFYPGLFRSEEWPIPLLPHYGLPHWVNRLSWAVGIFGDRFFFHRAVNRHRDRLGLSPVTGSSFDYLASGGHSLLATDPALSPVPEDVRVPLTQTGFWFYEGGGALSPELEAFLEAGDPPIYLGFGSMATGDPGRLTRTLIEAVQAVGCRAVISSGWAELGAGGLPETIRLTGPVSHAALFPRMAAIVHHGGAGTTARAAYSGRPQVIVPHLMDQYYWARRVELTGIGPRGIPSRRLTAPALANALRAALEEARLQEAAQRLAPILRARHGLEVAVQAIEALPRPFRGTVLRG